MLARFGVDLGCIEVPGIELTPGPAHEVAVARMGRVARDLQEIEVAGNAAVFLGWALTSAVEAQQALLSSLLVFVEVEVGGLGRALDEVAL